MELLKLFFKLLISHLFPGRDEIGIFLTAGALASEGKLKILLVQFQYHILVISDIILNINFLLPRLWLLISPTDNKKLRHLPIPNSHKIHITPPLQYRHQLGPHFTGSLSQKSINIHIDGCLVKVPAAEP